jgi:hypothetical protein
MVKASSLQGSNEELALEFAKTAVAAREKSAYGLQDFVGQAKGLGNSLVEGASNVDWKGLGQKAMANPELTGAAVGAGIGGLGSLRDPDSRRNILQHTLMGAATGGATGLGYRMVRDGLGPMTEKETGDGRTWSEWLEGVTKSFREGESDKAPISAQEEAMRQGVLDAGGTGAWAQRAADNEVWGSGINPVVDVGIGGTTGAAAGIGGLSGYNVARNLRGGDRRIAHALSTGTGENVDGIRENLRRVMKNTTGGHGLGDKAKPNWKITNPEDVKRFRKAIKRVTSKHYTPKTVGRARSAYSGMKNLGRASTWKAGPKAMGAGATVGGVGGALLMTIVRNAILRNAENNVIRQMNAGQ